MLGSGECMVRLGKKQLSYCAFDSEITVKNESFPRAQHCAN